MKVQSNLSQLRKQLEEVHNRQFTVEEIARGSDLSRHTITSLLDDNASAVYYDTITGLIRYLRQQGLKVGISDLLRLEENGTTEGKVQPVQVASGAVVRA